MWSEGKRHKKCMHCRCAKLKGIGGAVAQLGARLDGIEEVEGSNPFGSTNPSRAPSPSYFG